jgi:hypothetical protein
VGRVINVAASSLGGPAGCILPDSIINVDADNSFSEIWRSIGTMNLYQFRVSTPYTAA